MRRYFPSAGGAPMLDVKIKTNIKPDLATIIEGSNRNHLMGNLMAPHVKNPLETNLYIIFDPIASDRHSGFKVQDSLIIFNVVWIKNKKFVVEIYSRIEKVAGVRHIMILVGDAFVLTFFDLFWNFINTVEICADQAFFRVSFVKKTADSQIFVG